MCCCTYDKGKWWNTGTGQDRPIIWWAMKAFHGSRAEWIDSVMCTLTVDRCRGQGTTWSVSKSYFHAEYSEFDMSPKRNREGLLRLRASPDDTRLVTMLHQNSHTFVLSNHHYPRVKLERRNRDSIAVVQVYLESCVQEGFSHCVQCMNGRISLFGLTTLSFELYKPKHYVFLESSSSKNRNITKFFKRTFLEKKDRSSPMKSVTFCWTWISSVKKITNLTSNFTWRE
jgi:hypothetical protein